MTIYALSQEFSIGEQKLKAGFQKLYQQTIWDYANQVRMNRAAVLLKDPEKALRRYQHSPVIRVRRLFGKCSRNGAGRLRENSGPLSEKKLILQEAGLIAFYNGLRLLFLFKPVWFCDDVPRE